MTSTDSARQIEILLVEDNPGDATLTVETFENGKMRNNLHVVEDGVEAMAFLRRENEYAKAPRPDLILLDLNLPRKDGRQVLQEIKDDEDLKTIPVVVLTTSAADEDIHKSYGLHANCYIRKPINLKQFVNVVEGVEQFWFTIVTLPRR
jgi:chemotaxis family two-component system response regulator Rcp1